MVRITKQSPSKAVACFKSDISLLSQVCISLVINGPEHFLSFVLWIIACLFADP